jgi:hypothetical protein
MKTFVPAFFFVLGTVLVGVGIVFHYQEKKNYGEYFFFGVVAIGLGVMLA